MLPEAKYRYIKGSIYVPVVLLSYGKKTPERSATKCLIGLKVTGSLSSEFYCSLYRLNNIETLRVQSSQAYFLQVTIKSCNSLTETFIVKGYLNANETQLFVAITVSFRVAPLKKTLTKCCHVRFVVFFWGSNKAYAKPRLVSLWGFNPLNSDQNLDSHLLHLLISYRGSGETLIKY